MEFELYVQYKLVEAGYDVVVPVDHLSRYDGAILMGNKVLRYQVKTSELKDGKSTFMTETTNLNGINKYKPGEVDLFIMVPRNAPELACAIPYHGESSRMTIREDECNKVGVIKGKDHRMLEVLEKYFMGEGILIRRRLPREPIKKLVGMEYAKKRALESDSGFIGVQLDGQYKREGKKYKCRIYNKKRGINIYIGSSTNPKELAEKYDKRVVEIYGSGAITNKAAGLL